MSAAAEPLALPPAAPPAPRRQVFIGTALACVAGTMLIGPMLAIWVLFRERHVATGARFPIDYIIPEVATNVMLITIWGLCVFAQWAVWSATRGDRTHTALALGVTGVFALAFINAQAYTWNQMGVEVADSYYGALFYAMTGTMTAVVLAGLIFTIVAAFHSLAGRLREVEVLSAHALFWYWAAAAYSAVWFFVYVTK